MHATVRRNKAVVRNWTDGLSPERRQAAVRGLLDFEGFRSPNRWTDPSPSAGRATDVARSNRLAATWLRRPGRGDCR
jgi:hypothetical protein